jgi:mono/diheme cytochrome c family protein
MAVVVALATASCEGSTPQAPRLAQAADRPQGAAELYAAACASCHGLQGDGGVSGVPLGGASDGDPQRVIDAIRYGVGGMPASSEGMRDEQVEALVEYVSGLRP